MSNKGLTFLIILLLILCGATFGAFYLKIHPEIALSQKIFGKKVSVATDENINPTATPVDNSNGYTDTNVIENVVPPVQNNIPPTDKNVVVTPIGNPDDVVIVDTKTDEPIPTPKPQPTPTPTPDPVTPDPKEDTVLVKITLNLKKGSTGSEVKILQQFLIDNEYLVGKNDGIFGPITESAVKKFQTEYKLTADGIVGGKTRDTINEILSSN